MGRYVVYELHGRRYSMLGYADDIVFITKGFAGIQSVLAEVDKVANAAELSFNPRKCASLHVDCREVSCVVNTHFEVSRVPVRVLREGRREYVSVSGYCCRFSGRSGTKKDHC